MARVFRIVLVVVLFVAAVGGMVFGVMVLAGLSGTAGDKYGPLARLAGFVGIALLIPAFKLGAWVARRRHSPPPDDSDRFDPE